MTPRNFIGEEKWPRRVVGVVVTAIAVLQRCATTVAEGHSCYDLVRTENDTYSVDAPQAEQGGVSRKGPSARRFFIGLNLYNF
jgi:hypothetical protein